MSKATRRYAAAALAAAAYLALLPDTANAADEPDVRIGDARVTESSGLAPSRRHPHTVWTTNDSGDRGVIYAVDLRSGKVTGAHTYSDKAPRDVEAMGLAPDGRLLVADIGDNSAQRSWIRVWSLPEPALGTTSAPGTRYTFAYPDGAHDAETLLVHPRTGRLCVVTKGLPGAVYAAPAKLAATQPNRLTRVGAAPVLVTDGVFLADGSRVALRDYGQVHLVDAETWQVTASAALPAAPQGESITVDGSGLLVGSEGAGSGLWRVPVPTASPTSTAQASTSPTSAASGMSSSTADPTASGAASATSSAAWAPQTDAVAQDMGMDTSADWTPVAIAAGGIVCLALAIWGMGRARRRDDD
ncbi:WD40 repeat domain-containing protein [Actinomycetota bacterium]